jgi:hypothetical protein
MTTRQRLASSVEGAADEARGKANVPRASTIVKADDLVIRIDRPLPPPAFVCDSTCEAILGIDRAVFRRVAKRLPHRREHGVYVVDRELIVAELRSTTPAPSVKEKPKPVADKNTTVAESLERAGFRRAG